MKCWAPLTGLNRQAAGNLKPCCIFETDEVFHDLDTYRRSPLLQRVVHQLSEGQLPPECGQCRRDEELGRVPYYHHYREDSINIDIRDRICNLECPTCGSHSSSAHDHNFPLQLYPKVDNWEQIYRYLQDNAKRIKRAYFAGGEPFMTPHTFKVLDILEPDCPIYFNSNLSIIHFKKTPITELLARFTNVAISPSCDGTWMLAEFLRRNLDFKQFLQHLDLLRRAPNISIARIDQVLNVATALRYQETKDFWSRQGLELGDTIMNGTSLHWPLNVIHYRNELFHGHDWPFREHMLGLEKQVARPDLNFMLGLERVMGRNLRNYLV